jgi:hypothetical protein
VKRRTFARLDRGRKRLVAEMLDGHWKSATTEKLQRLMCEYAGLSYDEVIRADAKTGDLAALGMYYLTQSTMKNRTLVMELPSGRKVTWRAIRSVKWGKPKDKRRAASDDAYAREGVWVRFKDLRGEDSNKIAGYYISRQYDGDTDRKVIDATRRVLARHDPKTRVEEVWDEIINEIDGVI